MGEGFASSTPLRNRPLAGTSGLLWPRNTTNNPPPPPRKDKGKGPENNFRDPAEEEMSDSDETQQNIPPRNNTPRQQPTGYGIHSTANNPENMYQPQFQQQPQPQIPIQQPQPIYVYAQPEHSNKPNIIRNKEGLYYDGSQFMKFLHWFERAAYGYGATDREKAIQIPRFIPTEELKCELKEMEGYKEYDWTKLQANMIKTWGDLDNTIMYNTDDLIKLAKQQSKEGIANHQDYKAYLGKFTAILKYLVKNEHVTKMDEAGGLFLSAFSVDSQQSVKRMLVYNKQLPKAKDGSSKAPKWEDLIAAAETEVWVNKGYTNFSSFSDSNQIMQKGLDLKKGNSKQREKMLREVPNKKAIAQEIKDTQQKLASLQHQMENPLPSTYNQQGASDRQEFTRGNA
ncbi:hypothetical protein PTTG_10698 [Puccinia triticina 1-1 BBBD Race 1]|uniref:Uncharacterized protein n=1 Tax=Puccinia triticina (isolate 1-1 / race 1 (BBBD)) TaxID=630390 RepID=A0A180GI52_PUCT1|nr:hypothetical protein PTTG_10698 [Puccinia triticina 1-1 BBBD Race 1]